jgi:hypothetical protein
MRQLIYLTAEKSVCSVFLHIQISLFAYIMTQNAVPINEEQTF